jgi:hypothetical protein
MTIIAGQMYIKPSCDALAQVNSPLRALLVDRG